MPWKPTLLSVGAELCRKHWKILFIILVLIGILTIANIEELYRNRTESPPILSSVSYRLSRRKFNTEAPSDVWINQEDVRLSLTRKAEFMSKQYLSDLAQEYIEKNDDFTTKPRQIQRIHGSRNPCWMEREVKRCLPSFFMAGFSKSGTTDLWHHLIRHKQILSDYDNKEPCWWGWRRISSDVPNLNHTKIGRTAKQKNKITMSQYLENFHHKNRDLLIVDGSTDNIWNNYFMSRFINKSRWSSSPSERLVQALNDFRIPQFYLIQQYTPTTKYILILRDPADRLFSAYKFAHYKNPGKGDKLTPENFHRKVVLAIELFNKCLIRTNDVRYCTYSPDIRTKQKKLPVTIQKSLYVIFITDVLKLMDRENMYFIHFDEYHKSRARVLEKVFQFLGVDLDQELISQVEEEENSHVENSSKDQQTDIGPMWNKTRAVLRRFYRPFNQELALLLGDQRFLFEGK